MRTHAVAAALVAGMTALAPAWLVAQIGAPGPPPDPNAEFEAASIKASDPSSPGSRMMMRPGRIEASGVPAGLLLRQALRVQDYQIIGAPDWVRTERFTIVAKAPDGAPPADMPAMMLNLLKDRFKLETHTETREMPIFNLVLARSDGKLGPNLKPTSAECQAEIKARMGGPGPGGPGTGRGGPPPPPDFNFNGATPCGMTRIGPGIANSSGQPLAQLVQMLAQFTGRPVVDKTGLSGQYDFDLKWAPEPGGGAGPLGPPPPGAPVPVSDPDAPNIYTAVQEQLGVKLDSARGPVEVVVIDRIERPSLD